MARVINLRDFIPITQGVAMKLFVIVLLLASLTACALHPAPITTLDVRATLSPLEGEEQITKANDLTKQIENRKRALRKRTEYETVYWIISPLTTAIIYGVSTPARRTMVREIEDLERKELEIEEIIRNATSIDQPSQ